MNIRNIQLITTTTAVGKGANDGIYPPGGLLTIARALKTEFPELAITIDDQHHQDVIINTDADLVGIQVASTLCYQNSLEVAQQAKEQGKLVLLGGPHVTALYQQIMQKRDFVDFAIRGKGEKPLLALLQALRQASSYETVPSLSWRRENKVIHNPVQNPLDWNYDDFTPLPLHLLSSGMESYWTAFRNTINPAVDAAFLLFTHFGCGFRQKRIDSTQRLGLPVFPLAGKTPFCSYCSLDDPPISRDPQKILGEIKAYIDRYGLPKASKIHLKCYGDNIGPQLPLVQSLAQAIEQYNWWQDYDISWTFYCQSSYLNEPLALLLKRIGTSHLYIGYDGANDEVQRLNGLGTTLKSHYKATELCQKYGILIQAGSVVGLQGETPETLEELYNFFLDLTNKNVLERINSAVLFIIPGTPAYEMLAAKEPQIRGEDLLKTNEIRELWIKHFCSQVNLELLQDYADKIDALSPGPHASMGFESALLKQRREKVL